MSDISRNPREAIPGGDFNGENEEMSMEQPERKTPLEMILEGVASPLKRQLLERAEKPENSTRERFEELQRRLLLR